MTYNGEPLDDRLFHTWSMVPSRDEEVAAERIAVQLPRARRQAAAKKARSRARSGRLERRVGRERP